MLIYVYLHLNTHENNMKNYQIENLHFKICLFHEAGPKIEFILLIFSL